MNTRTMKKIASRLTKSIEASSTKKKSLESLFGAWKDNRDSDLIFKDIKESRTNSCDIVEF